MVHSTRSQEPKNVQYAQSVKTEGYKDLEIRCEVLPLPANRMPSVTEEEFITSLKWGIPATIIKGIIVKVFYEGEERYDKCSIMDKNLFGVCYEVASNVYNRILKDGPMTVAKDIYENIESMFD